MALGVVGAGFEVGAGAAASGSSVSTDVLGDREKTGSASLPHPAVNAESAVSEMKRVRLRR